MVLVQIQKLRQDLGKIKQPAGWRERLKETPGRVLDVGLQRDPQLTAITNWIDGTLAPIVRSLGDVGALNEMDIQRAKKLMPNLYPIPDTEAVIISKLQNLEALIGWGRAHIGVRNPPPFQDWKH